LNLQRFLFTAVVLAAALHSIGQDIFKGYEHLFTPPLQYTIHQSASAIKIDGKLNEPTWQNAPWSEYFVDIEGKAKPLPRQQTRFKMLWDQSYLYVAAELMEEDIWATLTKYDTIIFYDNDFEIFIDPDNDTHHYFEIEINALGTLFDLYMSKPYRNRGKLIMGWNAAGIKKGVHVEGSLNNNSDKDKRWTIEMAIPFADLKQDSINTPVPSNGNLWRINFSRVEWEINKKGSGYEKRKHPESNKTLPENNWVWSPQGVINMHFPERWGYAQFSGAKSGTGKKSFELPFAEEAKKYLRLIYYKQVDFIRGNKSYAKDLKDIEMPDKIKLSNGQSATIKLLSTGTKYTATIECLSGKWEITDDSKTSEK
jgi:hypothetical protein